MINIFQAEYNRYLGTLPVRKAEYTIYGTDKSQDVKKFEAHVYEIYMNRDV
jgi:hypothetical protein